MSVCGWVRIGGVGGSGSSARSGGVEAARRGNEDMGGMEGGKRSKVPLHSSVLRAGSGKVGRWVGWRVALLAACAALPVNMCGTYSSLVHYTHVPSPSRYEVRRSRRRQGKKHRNESYHRNKVLRARHWEQGARWAQFATTTMHTRALSVCLITAGCVYLLCTLNPRTWSPQGSFTATACLTEK